MICEFEAIAVYVRHRKENLKKKNKCTRVKKKTTQQFKTFGTLTVFQLWSIRGISICLLVLWHAQINTMEFLKCCKRSHFTKAKFLLKFSNWYMRTAKVRDRSYWTSPVSVMEVHQTSVDYLLQNTRNCGVSFCKDT